MDVIRKSRSGFFQLFKRVKVVFPFENTALTSHAISLKFTLIAVTLYAVILISRLIFFLFQPEDIVVGVVPDDAFYYMELARNFSLTGKWTFDLQAPATGFHLLYGYGLALLYYCVDPDWISVFFYTGLLNSILFIASAFIVLRTLEQLHQKALIPVAIAPFLDRMALYSATDMLETGVFVFIMSLCFRCMVTSPTKSGQIFRFDLIALGILGSLARTDFGLFIGVVFLLSMIFYKTIPLGTIKTAANLLLGCVSGVVIIMLHTYFLTESFVQISAVTKSHWTDQIGASINPIWGLIRDGLTSPFSFFRMVPKQILMSIILIAALVIWIKNNTKSQNERTQKTALHLPLFLVAALITLISALFIYSKNSQALQFWYYGNILLPVAIVIHYCFYQIFNNRQFVYYIVLACILLAGAFKISLRPFEGQKANLMIAKNMHLLLPDAKRDDLIGAWNAGILSHISDRNIVNLDGLVNDDIFKFLKNNSLYDYIDAREIKYLIDGRDMLEDLNFQKRGGYYMDKRMHTCFAELSMPEQFRHTGFIVLERKSEMPGC